MSKFELADLWVTKEADWVPIILPDRYILLAEQEGAFQEEESKRKGLRDRTMDPGKSLMHTIRSKQAEYAVKYYAGDVARVTKPGDFHNYPDVGQVDVRLILDPEDGLMIQKNDRGDFPMVLTTIKDPTFKDKTIWLVGWGITDLLRRHFYMINQFRQMKTWALIDGMLPHEQFVYPRAMLNPIKTLSKEFINLPFELK